ncbi:MAG: hypothetical protein DRH37_06900 [Deltaproteobacteria bacterium]|nr:MAG: hypothetical protein DRH37_06900 [Deltaproteobacteria bacterium]
MISRDPKRCGALALLLLVPIIVMSCSIRSVQIKRAEKHYQRGQYLASRGEVDRAVVHFEKSMNMSRAAGFSEGVAHNLNELAIIYTGKGEYKKARECIDEAVTIYRRLNMQPEISKSLNNMALTYAKEGRYREAIEHFRKLIAWDTKTGNRLGVGITLYNMALIYHRHMGNEEKALQCLSNAVEIFRETGNEKYIEMIKKEQSRTRVLKK